MIPCPRRPENYPFANDTKDTFDPCCSYCGSIEPNRFMDLVERGVVLLGATDKSYKVYVRKIPLGPDELKSREIKFYFYHLSEDQQKRFIELCNEDKIKFEGGFRFYVLPFFMRRDDGSEVS